MAGIRQTNFSAGELAPKMWGRSDLALFSAGARRLRNFFASREGAAVSRPGTRYVVSTKPLTAKSALIVAPSAFGGYTGPSLAGSPVRLLPFIYSPTEAFVLEVGEGYIRAIKNGVQVTDGGPPLEVAVTPYSWSDLRHLQFAQVGTVMTLVHPEHAPRELAYNGAAWTFAEVSFALTDPYWLNLALNTATAMPYLVEDASLFTPSETHPEREWQWSVSAIVQHVATGEELETVAIPVTWCWNGSALDYASARVIPTGNKVVLYFDKPVTLRRGVSSPLPTPPTGYQSYRTLAYNYYRGRGDLRGFVGTSKELDFIDVGTEPDYALQPLRATNPFLLRQWNSPDTYDRPGAVTYFENRLAFAGSKKRPGTVMLSSTDAYKDFDSHVIPISGEALTWELASRRREHVWWALGVDRLLLGSDAGVWSMGGVGEPLDFDSVDARVVDKTGSARLAPVLVEDVVLYASAKGRGVRALVVDQSGYRGRDVSWHAQHLLIGLVDGLAMSPTVPKDKHIVAWDYARDPWGVVWAVRNDGVLLSATPGAGGVWGWARHDTDGDVLDVCVVPEENEDGVYLLVVRTGGFYIERMESRTQNGTVDDDVCVDACVRYSGNVTSTFTGLDHLEGKSVYFLAKGDGNALQGPLVVVNGSVTVSQAPVANRVDLILGDQLVAYLGLPYTPELETLDAGVSGDGRVKQKTTVAVTLEVDQSRGLLVGQDEAHLVEWRQRVVADSYNQPGTITELVKVPVLGKFDAHARVFLRQSLPLPVTVLGLTREVDVGG